MSDSSEAEEEEGAGGSVGSKKEGGVALGADGEAAMEVEVAIEEAGELEAGKNGKDAAADGGAEEMGSSNSAGEADVEAGCETGKRESKSNIELCFGSRSAATGAVGTGPGLGGAAAAAEAEVDAEGCTELRADRQIEGGRKKNLHKQRCLHRYERKRNTQKDATTTQRIPPTSPQAHRGRHALARPQGRGAEQRRAGEARQRTESLPSAS